MWEMKFKRKGTEAFSTDWKKEQKKTSNWKNLNDTKDENTNMRSTQHL